jgi:hypothetical protein
VCKPVLCIHNSFVRAAQNAGNITGAPDSDWVSVMRPEDLPKGVRKEVRIPHDQLGPAAHREATRLHACALRCTTGSGR